MNFRQKKPHESQRKGKFNKQCWENWKPVQLNTHSMCYGAMLHSELKEVTLKKEVLKPTEGFINIWWLVLLEKEKNQRYHQ